MKSVSNDPTPPVPFPVVLRVLSLLPREVTLYRALRASPEWAETTAVGLTLEFVQRLRSQARVASVSGHAYVEPLNSRGHDDMTWFLARLLEYFANRVVPQQLVQDGGLPLRRLIVEAAASRPVIWIMRSSSVDEWVQTVLRDVVAGVDATLVVATPCCTAITVKDGTGSAGCVTLRFLAKNTTAGSYFNAAAAAGHLDCMRVIRDAVPAARLDAERGLQYQAACNSARERHPDCLRELLQWGTLQGPVDVECEKIAHFAIRSDSVECLRVAHEFAPNLWKGNGLEGINLVHLAAAGHPECLRVIRDLGVDIANTVGYLQRTASHEAARAKSVECLRMLIEWDAYSGAEDVHGKTPAHMAAEAGGTECLQLLLDVKLITPDQRDSLRERGADKSLKAAPCDTRGGVTVQRRVGS